jgi:hypothetical protein
LLEPTPPLNPDQNDPGAARERSSASSATATAAGTSSTSVPTRIQPLPYSL